MTETPVLTGQDISEAHDAVRKLREQILHDTGTTSNQHITLRVVAVRGPWTNRTAMRDHLCDQPQLGLDEGAADRLLDELEQRELITRGNPGDPDRSRRGPAHPADDRGTGHRRPALRRSQPGRSGSRHASCRRPSNGPTACTRTFDHAQRGPASTRRANGSASGASLALTARGTRLLPQEVRSIYANYVTMGQRDHARVCTVLRTCGTGRI